MGLTVTPIPCLKDNYAYLLVCDETGEAAVVDPSEGDPVRSVVEAAGLRLTAILNTHHHWDHTGGNEALLETWPGIPVYGHASDQGRIPAQTVGLNEGDTLRIGRQEARILHIPGHTTGAIAYVFDGAVFTGDTLFAGGCGRLFEGTPEMMYTSLNEKLGRLPGDTRVYFGHEYTQKNLEFALTLEPRNPALRRRKEEVDAARAKGDVTVPSTIAAELATNPFMRCDSPELRDTLRTAHGEKADDAVATLAAVRRLKDNF